MRLLLFRKQSLQREESQESKTRLTQLQEELVSVITEAHTESSGCRSMRSKYSFSRLISSRCMLIKKGMSSRSRSKRMAFKYEYPVHVV